MCAVYMCVVAAVLCGSGLSSSQVDRSRWTCHEQKGLQTEYVVIFKNYYWQPTRQRFITSVLRANNVTFYSFAERPALSNAYPSDFEVVLSSPATGAIVQSHSAVKVVSLQTPVGRSCKFKLPSNYSSLRAQNVVPATSDVTQVAQLLQVKHVWSKGITGRGIKVAVFDTGLPKRHQHFRNVKERTNWTSDKSLNDGVSHGTFVTGVIASSKNCFGIAPDVDLHIYKVFTTNQVSYTSWFLDAFNHALFRKINVLNLSIGGPDFNDQPFVDKVHELAANNVIIVSAIGNDGPFYGTLNNPGDQSDVIGVGGINFTNEIAKFSSRGMTTWELSSGYGRLKPDIVTYGSQIWGSDVNGNCRVLSGTSVASPIVTGAVALILSAAPDKLHMTNQASVKQILTEAATRLKHANMFEQGFGKLNITKSMELLQSYTPKITLSPPYIDYSQAYMWPYSSQPLYCSAMPSIVNVTIWNAVSLRGMINELPEWFPDPAHHGDILRVSVKYSRKLWPWSGWFSVHITVKDSGCYYEGESRGHVRLLVETANPGSGRQNHTVDFPISVMVTPKPPRNKRILWDQYHNLQYPPGFMPRDNLKVKSDTLDWRGDHLHTNFRDLYVHLRNLGFYIEILGQPFTCFDARYYSTLLIVDPEEEFFPEELQKLQDDVFDNGLSVLLFAEWYNTTVMNKIKFFDENTRKWWVPDTGGANVPALNDLLSGFGISLSDTVAEGNFHLGNHRLYYGSGTTLSSFPTHTSNIVIAPFLNDQGSEVMRNTSDSKRERTKSEFPVIGLFQPTVDDRRNISFTPHFGSENVSTSNETVLLHDNSFFEFRKHGNVKRYRKKDRDLGNGNGIGRVVVMGDSNCIDSIQNDEPCMWLLNIFLEYTIHCHITPFLLEFNSIRRFAAVPFSNRKVKRLNSSQLHLYSKVETSLVHRQDRASSLCETES